MPLLEWVSLCMSSRECATTALTLGVFCCKVNGELPHPTPNLSLLSTAGVAVSDNRVSAAAADQASLPGLGARGNTRILAQTGLRVHNHACGPALLSHMNTDSNACTHTMSPALEKKVH